MPDMLTIKDIKNSKNAALIYTERVGDARWKKCLTVCPRIPTFPY
jgi:hypothetical protein